MLAEGLPLKSNVSSTIFITRMCNRKKFGRRGMGDVSTKKFFIE